MTSEELRQIDADVATKVMGWELARDGFYFNPRCRYPDQETATEKYVFVSTHRFNPSTDLTDAFKVVEHLRKRGLWWEGALTNAEDESIDAYSNFEYNGTRPNYSAYAPTLPLAICEAALKAAKGRGI